MIFLGVKLTPHQFLYINKCGLMGPDIPLKGPAMGKCSSQLAGRCSFSFGTAQPVCLFKVLFGSL